MVGLDWKFLRERDMFYFYLSRREGRGTVQPDPNQ